MNWIAEEIRQAEVVSQELRQIECPRRSRLAGSRYFLTPKGADELRHGLRCQTPGLIVRQLMHLMNFDECRLFEWRLEHKLVQALVLHHFCPDSVPVTVGFGREFDGVPAEMRIKRLHRLLAHGHIVKPALGYASGERNPIDWGRQALEEIALLPRGQVTDSLAEEKYVIQRALTIRKEYRVNTMEDLVIPDLTFHRYDFGEVAQLEREAVNRFVKSILDQLPSGMLRGTLLGWDVAQTEEREFVVIEINIAGYHPVFEHGFHCTGLFSDPACFGPMIARLLSFVEKSYEVEIQILPETSDRSDLLLTYESVAKWKRLCRIARDVSDLTQEHGNLTTSLQPGQNQLFGDSSFHLLLSRFMKIAGVLNDFSLMSHFVTTNDLPRPLPEPDLQASAVPLHRPLTQEFVAPRTQTEQMVATIWGEILNVTDPGIFDDFLELGGNSIRATNVIARIRKDCGIEIPMSAFFESSWTIAAMSAAIDEFKLTGKV